MDEFDDDNRHRYYLIAYEMGPDGFTHSVHYVPADSPEEAAETFAGRPLVTRGKQSDLVCEVKITNVQPVRSILFYDKPT
jgi:hypothetical protein